MSLNELEIPADDFVRRFSMRSANLMWFLGAGASAAAGVPTAGDMIWEFKQRLYVSQKGVSAATVADLSSPFVREKLQAHIDSNGALPSRDADDEYSRLFEVVYPSEADRRTFINTKLAGAKPSYGHLAIASLAKAGLLRIIWTTNFDPLIADACASVYGNTGSLTTADLNSPQLAEECIAEGRFPLETKLHGDFRSRQLKNTNEELRSQDAKMRELLVRKCLESGLVVCGYSGRDKSIMDTFRTAITDNSGFPNGFFWLQRGHEVPHDGVVDLLQDAKSRGIEVGLIRIESFDEVLRDIVRISTGIDSGPLDQFGKDRRRVSDATMPIGKVEFPVLRYNAIRVTQSPTVCRRIVCNIGGAKEVREIVEGSGLELLAARVKSGVLLFGSDADVRQVFGGRSVTDFDLHAFEQRRFRYDSTERGLLRRALSRAVARNREMKITHHRNGDLLTPKNPNDPIWSPLKKLVGSLSGEISGTGLQWSEGLGLRLDWANEELWLLIEPRTIFDGQTDDNKGAAASFSRERTATRYNRKLNDLIDFWTKLIAGDGSSISSLGVTEGVDAGFVLSAVNGFSRRLYV